MNRVLASVVCGLCITTVVGCANMSNQDSGTIAGGALGGFVGNQFGHGGGRAAATVAGVMLGAYIGNSIGRTMDDVDRMKMNQALENNQSSQPTSWHNPDSGNSYTVTPMKTYYNNGNQPCREYSTTAIIGGKKQQIYGHACRQADGAWKVID
jgi:surface antigen